MSILKLIENLYRCYFYNKGGVDLGLAANINREDPKQLYTSGEKEIDPSYSIIDILQTILPNLLGPIGAAVLFYHVGVRLVDSLLEKHRGDVSELKGAIVDFFAKNNLGRVEIEDNRCISSLTVCTKPLPLADGGSISCYLVRGVFQRYLKHVKGFEVEVEEMRCVTKGSSACEFKIKEVGKV
jgi:predicted hydrocarbon binding protein